MEGLLPAEKRLAVFDKIFAVYHEARASIRNDLLLDMILLDLPGLLFFSTYTLLVLFWAEIYHQARSIPADKLRPAYFIVNRAVYFLQVRTWYIFEKVTKPEELVRLYDPLLQNTADLFDLLSSGRDKKEEEVALFEECEVKTLAFRAESCFKSSWHDVKA